MTMTKSSLTLFLVVAVTSNGVSKAANLRYLKGTTIPTNVITYTSYDEYAGLMLAAVNKQRATQGLAPLCLNQKLHTSAQLHSEDMAANDFMDHAGSDGSRMSTRITAAGYDWESVGENVAAGQIDVHDVMVSWINSPEHLENIMGDYTMFGSGYAFNRNGQYQQYWTQNFGSGEAEACDTSLPIPEKEEDVTQNVYQEEPEKKGIVVEPVPVKVVDVPAPVAPVVEMPVKVVPATEAPVVETPVVVIPEIVEAPGKEAPVTQDKDCETNFDIFSR
uniref:SCP domain-containing protein n=1 Tax=Hyaloperonospora arabidopsidis (strain Emoy2) TaxID=559515 RepID=M4BTI6_HYAAE